MENRPNWLDYDIEEMVAGDKNTLWHHLKPHKCFETQEQMIIEDENLLDNSTQIGKYLKEKLETLREYKIVGDVRGMGLFAGIEFVVDRTTKEPVTEGQMAQLMGNVLARNVIVGRTNSSFHGLNNVMNFAPSLIITREQVDTIVAAVAAAIEKTF